MTFDKNKPYNNLPLLPPLTEVETKAVLKKAILAREALGRLTAANRRLPNESLLVNAVLLQEAKSSSEIENIITTNYKLFQAAVSETKVTDPATKEVLRYPRALWRGLELVRERRFVNTPTFIEIVNIVKGNTAGLRKVPGTAVVNGQTKEIIYIPPEGESVIAEKLKNLEVFLNTTGDGIDLLVKMAIAHYQFEAIHPFHDGNGRTGRIMNILFLVQHGLLSQPILYLSKYIIEHKNDYYNALRGVTERGEWEAWIVYMLEAVEKTATHSEAKIEAICALMKSATEHIKRDLPAIYSRELVDELFRLPYCKRDFLVTAGLVKEKTAGRYLTNLEKIGILGAVKVGREKLYINKKFYELLKM
ncbi:MAG: addiction module protein [Candidatus Magasanikbacteria bacterium RIFCSPLOWO2_02_FULL_44_11]|uniref:Addiction module protein n=1 Tax=Candidatus Magasanikbacteria bacterium RIFCSPLOWO2_02_FULL_44_11 TaxID=1798689 RepID=A0A1F6N9C4_9BACT|nr:MAG: addiction module protein [Candidatus Magasanikbacteria bacterium RIFCSPLOWO2_02_FULL_44_11]